MANIDDMTVFDLNKMKEYIDLNDILFTYIQDDLDAIYKSCDNIIRQDALKNPGIIEKVKESYIRQTAMLLDDVRRDSAFSNELVNRIASYLQRYYDMIFAKIGMVNANNGTMTSYDVCKNYYICSDAASELAIMLEQKNILQNKR